MKYDPRPDPHLSDPAPVSSPGAAENVPSPGTSRPGAAPPAALRPPRTMAELKTMLPRLCYSARVEAQVRPQVDHCIAVYGLPLKRISADRAAFEAKWGRGAGGRPRSPRAFGITGTPWTSVAGSARRSGVRRSSAVRRVRLLSSPSASAGTGC